jgi:hypothetical protein
VAVSAAARARAAIGALAICLTAHLACDGEAAAPGGAAPGDELQTVEVAPPPDARVDPSQDVKERRRAESFAGVLPSGFPAALPVPSGASLVDQGSRWVELLVARPPARLREEYVAQLRAAGWEVASRADGLELRRGSADARVRLRADGSASRVRLEY